MTVTTPARFTCFGLTVGSELPLAPLDPLPPGGPGADVTVRRGPVPASLGAGETGGGWLRAAPGRVLLDVPAVGRILIRDGREIVVDAAAGVSDRTAGLWVLGSGLSALLHQRGLLVLHASAVAGPDGAAALLGRSGRASPRPPAPSAPSAGRSSPTTSASSCRAATARGSWPGTRT